MLKRILHIVVVFLFGVVVILQTSLCQDVEHAKRKMTVAVINFEAVEGVSSGEARSLSDVFSAQLMRSHEFTVVDRNTIQSILMEQGFQQSEACSNVECVTEVGKILKAEQIVSGRIGKVGRVFNVTVQAINVTSAQIIFTSNKAYVGDIEGLLLDIIPQMASDMVLDLTGKKIESAVSIEYTKEPLSIGWSGGFISCSGTPTHSIGGSRTDVTASGTIIILSAIIGELLRNFTVNPEISFIRAHTFDATNIEYSFETLSLNLNTLIRFPGGTHFTPYIGGGVGYYFLNPFGDSMVQKSQKVGITGLIGVQYKIEKSRFALLLQARYVSISQFSSTGILAGINYSLE